MLPKFGFVWRDRLSVEPALDLTEGCVLPPSTFAGGELALFGRIGSERSGREGRGCRADWVCLARLSRAPLLRSLVPPGKAGQIGFVCTAGPRPGDPPRASRGRSVPNRQCCHPRLRPGTAIEELGLFDAFASRPAPSPPDTPACPSLALFRTLGSSQSGLFVQPARAGPRWQATGGTVPLQLRLQSAIRNSTPASSRLFRPLSNHKSQIINHKSEGRLGPRCLST
jgi:hypothetical protein